MQWQNGHEEQNNDFKKKKKKKKNIKIYTFSRSALSILLVNSLRSRSILLKLDEYFGNVGGGIGRAAIAGFSCDLLTLCIPAVGVVDVVPDDEKFAIYAPGDDKTGLTGGTGGPWVGCGTGALILLIFN